MTRVPEASLRVLALSSPGGFSGLPDAVLRELAHYCGIVSVVDGLRIPLSVRVLTALRTFHPRRQEWGRRHYAALGRYVKQPKSLLRRIRRCEREIGTRKGSYDLIYQFGALFGALRRPSDEPLALHIDFTTRLAEQHYPAWLPASQAETEEWNSLEGEIYRSADLILVPTGLVAASLTKHYNVTADKIAIVGMGAHIEGLSEEFLKPETRMLVFAGCDFDRQGGELALQIFQSVRERFPGGALIMITNRSIGAPGVQSLGILPRPHLHEILKEAAVLVMPGPVGGYQTVTEGMMAKCLCVVRRDNPHMAGLIRNGENGVTFAHPTEAAEQIVEYLKAPDDLRAAGENARRHVMEECSWPRVADRIWQEIQSKLYRT